MKQKLLPIGTKIEILTDGAGVGAIWKKGDIVYIRNAETTMYGTSKINEGEGRGVGWISTSPSYDWRVVEEKGRREIIEEVLSQIKEDVAHFDWTAIEELLANVPESELRRYLSLYRQTEWFRKANKLPYESLILKDIDNILKHGTSFASFDYHDRRRNVLIGTEAANGYSRWGTFKNRAIVEHNGKSYLVAREMDSGEIKNFDLSKITGWKWK